MLYCIKTYEANQLLNSEIAYNLLSHSTKEDCRSAIITSNNTNFDLKKFTKYEKSETENDSANKEKKKIDWINVDGNKYIIQKGNL